MWSKQWRIEFFYINMKRIEHVFCFKECPPGYLGDNCSEVCEYPTFGNRCANHCSCEKHLCNFLHGCTNGKYSFLWYGFEFEFAILTLRKCCHFNSSDNDKLIRLLLTCSLYVYTMFTMKETFQVNIQNLPLKYNEHAICLLYPMGNQQWV